MAICSIYYKRAQLTVYFYLTVLACFVSVSTWDVTNGQQVGNSPVAYDSNVFSVYSSFKKKPVDISEWEINKLGLQNFIRVFDLPHILTVFQYQVRKPFESESDLSSLTISKSCYSGLPLHT